MVLNDTLVSQFVKATKDDTANAKDPNLYGTIVEYNGGKYVQLDGSELLTPISSTTNVDPDDRVSVAIKNHTAIVTGNVTSPSATNRDVGEIGTKITEFEVVIADKVDADEITAVNGRIDNLVTENVDIKDTLTANSGYIRDLAADNVLIKDNLTANNADITDLRAENVEIRGKLTARDADIDSLQADNVLIRDTLEAHKGNFEDLNAYNATITGTLEAVNAEIERLEADKISTGDLDAKYANIDFSNIGQAAMEYFYAQSGLIENVTIGDATISGNLVGVTISGDLIEGNTIVADKLVIKGDDGVYYKLNTDGVSIEAEQTDYNSINGSVIKAKSITATKIDVKDLVAFDATIGGFKISDNSIYSGVKESVDNNTRGIYLDNDGQVAFGDTHNFIKFYVDTDGTYKLAIAAESMTFSSTGLNIEEVVTNAQDSAGLAQSSAETNTNRLDNAESEISKLRDSISTLVRGENGESLMTQTDDGWSFNMANILDTLNKANNNINDLNEDVAASNGAIDSLNTMVNDLGIYTEYIKFKSVDGQPTIELGETDSPFKVVITNTDIRFMEGTNVPASISNQSLNIGKAVITDELKQGGFVWMARSNGNLGLLWKGD